MGVKTLVGKLAGECVPAIGLDVGQNAVKVVVFARPDGRIRKPVAFRLDRKAEGIVDDDDLFSHLGDWLTTVGARTGDIVVGIPQHVTTVQITRFPPESVKALDAMVAFQTHQLAELSDDTFVHDYRVMGGGTGGDLPVVIGVCLNTIVRNRAERYAAAGIRLADFGIGSLAMASAFFDLRPELGEDGKSYLLLDIGSESTTMVVVCNRRILFCGTLDFGGDAYSAALGQQQEDSGARRSLRRTHIRSRDQDSAVGKMAQVLLAEIRSGIDYWHEQHEQQEGGAQPDGVFLCGGGAALPGLLDFLERSMDSPVAILHVPGIGEAGAGSEFVTAYGLALHAAGCSEFALSLAPPEIKWHATREKRANVLVAATAALILLLAALFALEWRSLGIRTRQVDQQLAELRRCEAVIAELEKAAGELQALETVQLPVIEHGNRAGKFARAIAVLSEAKGKDDWFVYLGDREAFDAGKKSLAAETGARRPGTVAPPNPFAAPVFRSGGDESTPGTGFPVAAQTMPLSGMVAVGYTRLIDDESYRTVREMIEALNKSAFFSDADVLAASELLGREAVFSGWTDYLETEREKRQLPHEVRRFMLRLPFAENEITPYAPEIPDQQ